MTGLEDSGCDRIRALAERMLGGEPPPADLSDASRQRLAWTLKDVCYAAWSTEPQRAVRAADALLALCATHNADTARAREIEALARWTTGIAHLTRGEMADAVRSFDDAAERFEGLGKPHEAAQTRVPKIMALAMLGRHDEAAASSQHARRVFVAHGDERAAAKVSLNLGSLSLRRDAFADAARHYRDAAVLFARAGDLEHSIMADIGIADAQSALGDFDEALRIYARAGMRAKTHGFPVLDAMHDESLALLELARGHYREALAGFERSRARYEALAMPQHLAIAEKQLADAYLELRLLPEAMALYDLALAKFEQQQMRDDLAWTLAQRARVQAMLGHLDKAAATLERAARMFAALGNSVGESAVTLARAEVALALGDAVGALALAEEAREGFIASNVAERLARAELVCADALLRQGAAAAARHAYAALLARARELQLLGIEVRCLTGEGLAARAMDDTQAARVAFETAIELFEQQRRALPGDELRTALLADHLVPYRELLRIALDAHANSLDADDAVAVLTALDRFRARALAEKLAHGPDADRDEDAATRDLRAHLNWLQRRVQRAYDEAADASTLVADMRRCERDLLERVRRRRLVAQPSSPTTDDEPLDVHRLRRALGERDAMIEFGVIGDELFACVATSRGIAVRRAMASWSETIAALRAARFQVDTLRHGGAHVAHQLPTLTERARRRLSQLYAHVLAPLEPELEGCARVLIVPHAELGALPFAALHDGTAYLGERLEIAVAPSARLALAGLSRAVRAPRDVLAVGVADRLPHARAEASRVADLFEGARLLLADDASIEAFVAASGAADVIHVACHAQFRDDSPMFSALYLHDGAFTAENAERLRLRPGIVVLSGCETGASEHGAGDEMIGLVRAFFVGGAARVLASHWPVDDAVTAEIIGRFYRALGAGSTCAAAIRVAQRAVMQRHPHPFYWSAFSVYGGW